MFSMKYFGRKSSEGLHLLANDSKAIEKDIHTIQAYCVVETGKENEAHQALTKKKASIDEFLKAHNVPEWNEGSVKVGEKSFKARDGTALISVTITLAALNVQAVIDGVKVPVDNKELEKMLKDEKDMTFAKENDALYPSTHFILVPYAVHNAQYVAKDKRTKHSFTESQLIWLANSLFDFDQLQAAQEKTGISSYFFLHDFEAVEEINFGGFLNALWSESKNYTYNEFSKSKENGFDKYRTPADELKGPEDVFNKIRSYYGEQTALYFRFATHLSKWTGGLGLFGALCQAYIFYTMDFESPMLALFAIMVIVWANLFTENWKKNELQCTYRWGTDEFESREETRPKYNPPKVDKKNKEDLIYAYDFEVDNNALMLKQTLSAVVIAVIMLCVVCSTIMIYQFKSFLQVEFVEIGVPSQLSATCASLLNLIQIYVFKFIYQYVSIFLNNFENHRTVTEHEDSMISKLTIFTFFNTYISFFYIAFVAGSMSVYTNGGDDVSLSNQCGYTGCMAMLAENLLVVLVMSLTSDKFTEFVVMPLVSSMNWDTIQRVACCIFTRTQDIGDGRVEDMEKNYRLSPYDFSQRLADYTTLFTYFGYIVLFSPALPVAPLLVAISCAFETRGDLNKLKSFRRTWARAQNIGAWQSCFEVITVAGVISNSAMIVFTMRIFSAYDFVVQMWIFIGMQWLMFSLLALGANVISGPPYKVQIQRRRLDYYKSTLPKLFLPFMTREDAVVA